MKTASLAALFALVALAAAAPATAGPLPLKPGAYVLAGSACADHANAAEFTYDGKVFSDPHASRCVSKVLSHVGHTYRITTTCSANGDGSPAAPFTTVSTYRLKSATRVSILSTRETSPSDYRWCPSS